MRCVAPDASARTGIHLQEEDVGIGHVAALTSTHGWQLHAIIRRNRRDLQVLCSMEQPLWEVPPSAAGSCTCARRTQQSTRPREMLATGE
ncbi:hypothetical protein Y1Q_0000257 [Alligator mississippiensis]|uniref:Uncharacterized protein n=1 Tax=Alligator mississippiensis TaxID=8496 RepID=A0A151P0E7_ALLMI|nr:hypothetical protein Y1Q_0000257 [Alligator mississippiensis]